MNASGFAVCARCSSSAYESRRHRSRSRSAALLRNRRPLLVWVWHQSVRHAADMIFGQVFRDRLPFAVHKQQAVTVFVNLHIIAGTDPGAVLNLFDRVRIGYLSQGQVCASRASAAGLKKPDIFAEVRGMPQRNLSSSSWTAFSIRRLAVFEATQQLQSRKFSEMLEGAVRKISQPGHRDRPGD